MEDDSPIFSGVARGLRDDQLACEVARQMLASLKAERGSTSLQEAVRVALATDVSMAEMERMSGYTRPTLYSAKKQLERELPRTDDTVLLTRQVLVVLAASGGSVPVAEIARRLRFPAPLVNAALSVLAAQDLCVVDGPRGQSPSALSAAVTSEGKQVLRAIFDDLFLRRPDAYSVYLRVDPAEQHKIEAAAARVMSSHEHTLMDASVAPSSMSGPELALAVHAPSSRTAVSISHDVWQEVRRTAELEPRLAWVADVIAPSPLPAGESEVLDAFVEAVVREVPEVAGEVSRARMRFAGGIDERTLAGRCVTSAALALRRAAGSVADPRPITDGEEAAEALAPAQGVTVDAKYSPVKRATRRALQLAADRLGPFRGGELGSFTAPHGRARVVPEVSPTTEDLIAMAREAGRAVGAAGKLGLLDATKQTMAIITPVQ